MDGDGRGPVVNTVVLSASAPGYSPDDRALVATTVLGAAGDAGTEAEVRTQLRYVYGADTSGWELLRVHALPQALTAMPPPLDVRRPVALGERRLRRGRPPRLRVQPGGAGVRAARG